MPFCCVVGEEDSREPAFGLYLALDLAVVSVDPQSTSWTLSALSDFASALPSQQLCTSEDSLLLTRAIFCVFVCVRLKPFEASSAL